VLIAHYEQGYANSCIPACMCILQLWRGEAATEELFHYGALDSGHDLHITTTLDRVSIRALAADEDEEITLALKLGYLVLAILSGPPYVAWFTARYPAVISRHGQLCGSGSHGRPLHAVVLSQRLDGGYRYHDPWYPADGQPFAMSEDDFQRCFAGLIAVAQP
jgi:hypothetical protein